MVEEKKQALKKLFHNYSLVVIVAVGLIMMLLMLIGIRLLALVSIGDLSNINPLITSGQNKLVVKDGTNEVVKIPIDEEIAQSRSTKEKSSDTNADVNSSTGGSSSGKSGGSQSSSGNTSSSGGTTQSTGGGSSGGGSSSGSSGGSPPAPSPTPPPPVPTQASFTAGISSYVNHETDYKGRDWFGKCTITHKFTFTVTAQNAPGNTPAKAQWQWTTYPWGDVFNIPFSKGQTSNTVWYQWDLNEYSGDKEVKLRLVSPTSVTKPYGFRHQC